MQQTLSSESRESVPKSRVRSKNFQTLLITIKMLAGIVLLILTVRGIQIENLVDGITSANVTWLIGTLSIILLGLSLKLLRAENVQTTVMARETAFMNLTLGCRERRHE